MRFNGLARYAKNARWGAGLFALLCLVLLTSGCAALFTRQIPGAAVRTPAALRASAIVEMTDRVTFTGKATVLTRMPGSFRIDVTAPLGGALAVFISDGTVLYTYSGGQQRLYHPDDPNLPFRASGAEVVSFLMGTPYPKSGTGIEVTTDAYGRVTRLVKKNAGSSPLTVVISDYREVSGAVVPFGITIKTRGRTLKIRYLTVEIDPVINPDSFRIAPFQ